MASAVAVDVAAGVTAIPTASTWRRKGEARRAAVPGIAAVAAALATPLELAALDPVSGVVATAA
jgi:hypothetical protein